MKETKCLNGLFSATSHFVVTVVSLHCQENNFQLRAHHPLDVYPHALRGARPRTSRSSQEKCVAGKLRDHCCGFCVGKSERTHTLLRLQDVSRLQNVILKRYNTSEGYHLCPNLRFKHQMCLLPSIHVLKRGDLGLIAQYIFRVAYNVIQPSSITRLLAL